MGFRFETLGNAAIQVFADGAPLLITDPWLRGTGYFGSWALDWPLTERQIADAVRSPFVWISHGHQDHLHHESVELLDKETQEILLPDHYSPEIADHFRELGFQVRVLRFKEWTPLAPGLRVMCVEHHNQDSILAIEAGDALLIDRNDCPLHGEKPFFRRLVRRYEKTFLACICAIDADMLNFVDAEGRSVLGPPDERKPGAIWDLSDLCTYLGVEHYCHSSSQHLYVRSDSTWANPYRITYPDIQKWWNARGTGLIPPFSTVDCDDRSWTANHPDFESNWDAVTDGTGDDDWDAKPSAEDWKELEGFFARFVLLRRRLDFVMFTVGGESKTIWTHPGAEAKSPERRKGVHFRVPRSSLMETVKWGYFDDLLIGNFMQTELINASMYPDFTPIVAKYGGNSKVFTAEELRRFRRHYFRLSPRAYVSDMREEWWLRHAKPFLRETFTRLGLLEAMKRVGRRVRGLPPLPDRKAVSR